MNGVSDRDWFNPEAGGHMPLSCAVQWVLTEGNKGDPDAISDEEWRNGYVTVLRAVAAGQVAAISLEHGEMDKIPALKFEGCGVYLPCVPDEDDPYLSDEPFVRSYQFLVEDEWRDGLDDALVIEREEKWTRIMVAGADVAKNWPFHLGEESNETPPASTAVTGTGAPGRPSSMHLVILEFKRRWKAGLAEEENVAEAEALAQWFREKYPLAPPPTSKTIRNNLIGERRILVAAAQK